MPLTRSKAKSTDFLTPKIMNTIEKNYKIKSTGTKRKSAESANVNKNQIKKPKDLKKTKNEDEVVNVDNINKENHNLDNSNLIYYEKQVDDLQKVLSAKYFDVSERLKLDFTPNCVKDMVFCKNHHSKNCPAPAVMADNITCRIKHFITEKRPLNYLKICNSIMQQRIILNEDTLNDIFQLIIAHQCEDEIEHYTNDYVVNESKMTLINFINLFPPCWKSIRKIYINICTKPIDSSKYLPKDNNNSIEHRNLFLFILNMIEITIYENDEENFPIANNSSIDNSTAESDMIFNFKEWEKKNYKDDKMNAYNKEEKLSRLFLCLDIFVKIFEVDLSLWILRYLSTPYKHLFTNDMPLIMSAMLFKEFNPISDSVIKVINLFTILIINNFPRMQKNIFERLLSLLCVVMNVMDIKDNIKYPNIDINTINFGKKIFESFEATSEISFENFIKIIENIKIPYMRLLVIDQLLKKLDRDTNDEYLTPRKIYEKFGKLNWEKYKRSPDKINIKTEKILQEFDIPSPRSICYPKIETNIKYKSKILEFYREEYLYLHLEALKAFCDTFYTKSFLLILMDSCKPETSITILKELKKKKLDNKKFNLEKLEKDASKMLLKINLNDDFEKEILKEVPEYDGVCVNSDLMLQYRGDFKYLSLFKKNLPVMIKKFGKEFEIFTEFIEFCFTP